MILFLPQAFRISPTCTSFTFSSIFRFQSLLIRFVFDPESIAFLWIINFHPKGYPIDLFSCFFPRLFIYQRSPSESCNAYRAGLEPQPVCVSPPPPLRKISTDMTWLRPRLRSSLDWITTLMTGSCRHELLLHRSSSPTFPVYNYSPERRGVRVSPSTRSACVRPFHTNLLRNSQRYRGITLSSRPRPTFISLFPLFRRSTSRRLR